MVEDIEYASARWKFSRTEDAISFAKSLSVDVVLGVYGPFCVHPGHSEKFPGEIVVIKDCKDFEIPEQFLGETPYDIGTLNVLRGENPYGFARTLGRVKAMASGYLIAHMDKLPAENHVIRLRVIAVETEEQETKIGAYAMTA